jgi:organic radical activating enzyme
MEEIISHTVTISAEPYMKDETNPYVEAFYRWWETDLHKTLDELRITGGEPMMSPNLWRLLDWIETQGDKMNPNMRIAINSNLGAKQSIIDRFKTKLKKFNNFHLYTSCEATFQQAEYIRDGLDYSPIGTECITHDGGQSSFVRYTTWQQ